RRARCWLLLWRNKIIVARLEGLAVLLSFPRLRFPDSRQRLESWCNIGVLLDPLPEHGHIADHRGAAVADHHGRPPLVPVDAVGLNDVIKCPALLVEAAHYRRADRLSLRRGQSAGGKRCGCTRGYDLGGMQELATGHGNAPLGCGPSDSCPHPAIGSENKCYSNLTSRQLEADPGRPDKRLRPMP